MAAETPNSLPTPREDVLLGIDAIREANPGISVNMSNALTIGFNVGKRPPRMAGELATQIVVATSLSPEAVGKERLSLVSVRQGDDVRLHHIDSDMAGNAMTGTPLADADLTELDGILLEADFSDEYGIVEIGQRMASGKYLNWMHVMFDTDFIR
ncbi:MAG TPA: hypothetical protein VFT16_04085 [Candidatus Saccharimonadales bacterium]|nr:hypothetical protein [Candidatus Saccharimonadales bacterium]